MTTFDLKISSVKKKVSILIPRIVKNISGVWTQLLEWSPTFLLVRLVSRPAQQLSPFNLNISFIGLYFFRIAF